MLDHKDAYGCIPPKISTSAFATPLPHESLEFDEIISNTSGWINPISALLKHPQASVIFTLYQSDGRFDI